jgi:hypothetical protein
MAHRRCKTFYCPRDDFADRVGASRKKNNWEATLARRWVPRNANYARLFFCKLTPDYIYLFGFNFVALQGLDKD